MYVGKMFVFYIQQQQQQQRVLSLGAAETVLGLKRPFDSLSVRLHVSVAPLSIFIRGCASISLTTLSLVLPPTRPLASFPFLSWHWADLWPEGSKRDRGREDWRKLEGGRKHERKELENARGREHAGEGWAREKTPESEAMIWLLPLSSREGREECKDTERERKNRRERKRESLLTWPQGALSSLSFFLSLFITFYTNCPHTKH